jgi:hypothetical protein
MAIETPPPFDDAPTWEALARAVARLRSVEEVRRWLLQRPEVAAVEVREGLVKTEPPRQELVVRFRAAGGATVARVVDLELSPDGALRVVGVHD